MKPLRRGPEQSGTDCTAGVDVKPEVDRGFRQAATGAHPMNRKARIRMAEAEMQMAAWPWGPVGGVAQEAFAVEQEARALEKEAGGIPLQPPTFRDLLSAAHLLRDTCWALRDEEFGPDLQDFLVTLQDQIAWLIDEIQARAILPPPPLDEEPPAAEPPPAARRQRPAG